MILYASDPNGLAQQQQNYDNFYTANARANANNLQDQQKNQIELILRQRALDEAARRSDIVDVNAVQARDWQAGQTALELASRERNVAKQYDVTHQDRVDALNSVAFQKAQTLAANGLLPDDDSEIKKLYGVDDRDAKSLSVVNSESKLSKLQAELDRRARTGALIQPEEVKNYITPKSPNYKKAMDMVDGYLKPFDAEHKMEVDTAQRGNTASRIAAITASIRDNPNPIPQPLPWWQAPLSRTAAAIFNGVSSDNVIQPNGDWQANAPKIVASLQANPNSGVTYDQSQGAFVPSSPNPRINPSTPVAAPPIQAQEQLPLTPQDKSQLVVGKAYLTARGPARWDGVRWVKISNN